MKLKENAVVDISMKYVKHPNQKGEKAISLPLVRIPGCRRRRWR